MDRSEQLIVAMAERCRLVIHQYRGDVPTLSPSLHPKHLESMCDRIEANAEGWPMSRLHRWIGFIQCALIANGIQDLDQVKAMFEDAKVAYGPIDDDLTDHLDPDNDFSFDLGGEA